MTTQELDDAPSTARLYAAALGSLAARRRGSRTLPDDEVVRRDVTLDRDHLLAYQRVCGDGLRDRLPLTYLHVVAFPLSLVLLTRRDFPFALPGMVHVANRITQHRPLTVDATPTLRVRTRDLRPHPAGSQLEVVATAEVDGEVVWEDVSTYLSRGGGRRDAERPGPDVTLEPQPDASRIDVPADTGRRYAAVSGDVNPIHLHPLTARAFGFPRAIAHGMWTKARCLAALEGRIGPAATASVRFEKPLLLPARVRLSTRPDGDAWRFALHDASGDRRHLTGEVTSP